MDASQITCPQCHKTFALNAAIEQPIVERLRAEFQAEADKQQALLKTRESQLAQKEQAIKTAQEQLEQQVARKLDQERQKLIAAQEQKAREEVGVELRDLQNQLAEKSRQVTEAQQTQLELLKQKRQLDEQRQAFELEKAKQIEAEREAISAKATQLAAEASARTVRELQEKIAAKDKKLAETERQEQNLLREKAEFEEKKRAFDLELARKEAAVREATQKEKDEEFRLREAEKNKQMDDLKKQIDEWRRKSEQASQQTQGEVLELDLETALRQCFNDDDILPVAKGVHGGDILQTVRGETGYDSGAILWESKRTKTWSEGWLAKLKDDKLAAKAQLAVLVSATMPRDVPSFECREGIWITPPNLAVPLAAALRLCLIDTAAARRAMEGKHDKMEVMYAYLSGSEFKARLSTIVEAFTAMREDLEAEKRAMQKLWAKREKQLERVVANTVGMHGDLAGIIGNSLPAIDRLELGVTAGAIEESLPA